MPPVRPVLHDRFGRTIELRLEPRNFSDILALNRIPSSAVHMGGDDRWLTRPLNNVEAYPPASMLRTYHLADLVDPVVHGSSNGEYLRRFFIDNSSGDSAVLQQALNRKDIPEAVYADFLAAHCAHPLIEKGKRYVVGVSGGRDSLALTSLLRRLQREIAFEIVPVHLSATVPQKETDYVFGLLRDLGADVRCYDAAWIEDKFKLRSPLSAKLDPATAALSDHQGVALLHGLVCATLEHACDEYQCDGILYGLMMEDVFSSFVRRLTKGKVTRPLATHWGPYTYLYPMWALTKRDVFFYVNAEHSSFSAQSNATAAENGGSYRDKYYLLSDVIETALPRFQVELLLSCQSIGDVETEELARCGRCNSMVARVDRECFICEMLGE